MNSTRFSEVSPEMEARLRALLALPGAAERHLYQLPGIQVHKKHGEACQHVRAGAASSDGGTARP